jgi:solute carrier family 6 GABA transporter-like protein 1
VSSATTVYRWRDIVDQTGMPALVVYNVGFFGGQLFGIFLAYGVNSPGTGVDVGIGFWAIMSVVAPFIARSPDAPAPSFWNKTTFVRKFWYLAFYSVSTHTV